MRTQCQGTFGLDGRWRRVVVAREERAAIPKARCGRGCLQGVCVSLETSDATQRKMFVRTWVSDCAKKAGVESAHDAADIVVDEFSRLLVVRAALRQVLEFDFKGLQSRDERLQNFDGGCDNLDADSVTRDRCNLVDFLFAGHGGDILKIKGYVC